MERLHYIIKTSLTRTDVICELLIEKKMITETEIMKKSRALSLLEPFGRCVFGV